MKKSIFLLLLFFLFCNCSDDLVSKYDQSKISTRSAGDGNYDLLGYGYDITGDYYSSSSSKSQVIDINAFVKDHPDRIDNDFTSDSYGRLTVGKSAEDYTANLTANAKLSPSFKLFGGSLDASFEGSQHYSAKYSIAGYCLFVKRKKIFITSSVDLLSQYLSNKFKEDLSKQSVDYIIKNYGTHVLINIILGGRMNIMYRSLVTSDTKKEVVKAGCSFNIAKVFSLNVGGSYDQTLIKDNTEQELVYHTVGGDPTKALIGNLNLSGDQNDINVDISSWLSTCDSNYMALIDVDPGTAIPIYDLVIDTAKKAELKTAVENYMKEKSYVDFGDPTPLYRYSFDNFIWKDSYSRSHIKGPTIDYYYTTDYSEYGKGNDIFKLDKTVCYVYPTSSHPSSSVPLYEYTRDIIRPSISRTSYFYTTDKGNYHDCSFRRIAFYVYATNDRPNNSIPLYATKLYYCGRSYMSGLFFDTDSLEKPRLFNNLTTIDDMYWNKRPCYVLPISN